MDCFSERRAINSILLRKWCVLDTLEFIARRSEEHPLFLGRWCRFDLRIVRYSWRDWPGYLYHRVGENREIVVE